LSAKVSVLRSGVARGMALATALVIVLAGWLLAAPPGGSPDDGYHLGSIWCADGFKDGICLEDPGAPDRSRVLVPQGVTGLTCFQYDGQRSAECALDSLSPGLQQFIPVTGTNIGRERPNLYYRAMHVFVSDDLGTATARMRTANLLVVATMVILTAFVAELRIRRAYLLSSIVVSVPLGLFLATSLNTSAWGLAGLTTLWANALTASSHPVRLNRLLAALLAGAGLVLALGSRTEAIGHIAVIAVAVGAVMWWSRRAQRDGTGGGRSIARRLALGAGAVVGAALVVLVAPQTAGVDRILEDVRTGHDRLTARGIGDPFLAIAFEVPSLWTGALGHIWGLGALDTPIPTLATLPFIGVFTALLVLGLQHGHRGRLVAVAVVAISLFVFPTLALMRSGVIVFEELQPRQFMVLLFLLLGLAILRLPGEPQLVLGRGMRIATVVALGVGHAVALLVTMRRHISGLVEFRYVSFTIEIEWWWTSAPEPNLVWMLASIAYLIGVALVVGLFTEDGPAVSSRADAAAASSARPRRARA